jgi:uncharacterized protein
MTLPESGYKASQFNIVFDSDDGEHLAFNSISGALVEVRPNERDRFEELIADPNHFTERYGHDEKLLTDALRARFIVDATTDEQVLLEFENTRRKFSPELFYLTIMPTLACNMACPYCYESPRPGAMSEESQQRLLKWSAQKLTAARVMSVGWFGGEPLLAFDVVRRLAKGFLDLCENKEVVYSSGMTTNGYLLTREIADQLPELGVGAVQVTIDGPPHIHNESRRLKKAADGGSFDRIVENLTYVVTQHPGIRVLVRVNYNKNTYNEVSSVMDWLPDELKQGAQIYFRQQYAAPKWWDKDAPTKVTSVSRTDDYLDDTPLADDALVRGYDVMLMNHEPKYYYCEADFLNSYVVDPDCDLHKCSVAFDKEHRLGTINADGTESLDRSLLAKWMLKSTLDNEPCASCSILPMCNGGCSLASACSKKPGICPTNESEDRVVANLKRMHTMIKRRRQTA